MTLAQLIGFKRERRPDLRTRFGKKGSRGHDSDYSVRFGIQNDLLADNLLIASKTLLPQLMAQQHNMLFSKRLLLHQKTTTEDWLHT